MTILQALIIGIVQGLTEFLPVSSSGHIAILQALFRLRDPGITFAVAVHIATLAAVLVAFWRDVVDIVAGVIGGLFGVLTRRLRAGEVWRRNTGFRTGILLLVGSLPAGLVGIVFKDAVERLFASLLAVGLMLLVTGALLWLTDRVSARGVPVREVRPGQALLIGLFQAAAVAPGLSRSGSTIAGGRLAGLSRDAAARFSFLLSIPAILGAALVDLKGLAGVAAANLGNQLIVGMAAAAVVGYLAIRIVMRFVRAGKLRGFAYYCWAVGLAVIVWQLLAH